MPFVDKFFVKSNSIRRLLTYFVKYKTTIILALVAMIGAGAASSLMAL